MFRHKKKDTDWENEIKHEKKAKKGQSQPEAASPRDTPPEKPASEKKKEKDKKKKLGPQLTGPFSPESECYDFQADRLYKVIVLGDSNVGKTGLMSQWVTGLFNENTISTINVDCGVKTYRVREKVVKIQLWDTAGQERFKAVTKSFMRGAHAAALVYDVTSRESYESILKWTKDVKEVSPNCLFMLIGNKSDLNEFRSVLSFQAFEFARDNGMSFMETSAKSGKNCAEAFQQFMQEVHSFWDTRQDQFTLEEPEEVPGQNSERAVPVLPSHSDVVQLYNDNGEGEKKPEEQSFCCPGLEVNRDALRPSQPDQSATGTGAPTLDGANTTLAPTDGDKESRDKESQGEDAR